jgi:hypothetical protein
LPVAMACTSFSKTATMPVIEMWPSLASMLPADLHTGTDDCSIPSLLEGHWIAVANQRQGCGAVKGVVA